MKRLILTDQASFKSLRNQNAVYIDKTQHIYDMVTRGKYFFLARPRRFGKSLLCSTLVELFKGNRDLFKGLWIHGSEWKWQAHPVIHLNMTRMAGSDRTMQMIHAKFIETLEAYAADFGVTVPPNQDPAGMLSALVIATHKKYGIGVVVIIDEYDILILDKVLADKDYKEIQNFLSNFYRQLKELEDYLELVFITGVYKFTKTSLFSSLNNLRDLTFDPRASALVGYTQEELETNFSDEINLLAQKMSVPRIEILATLRRQYNGYRFGVDMSTGQISPSVYNSFGLNNVFEANALVKKWFASGSPSFLIKKIKEGNFEMMADEGIITNFGTLNDSCSPDAMSTVSLLYYAGYATLQKYNVAGDIAFLTSPNSEVSEAMASHLLGLFKKATAANLELIAWQLAESFRLNTLDLIKDQLNQALAQLTYEVLQSEEHYFELTLHLLLIIGRLNPQLEVPTNHGRMDMVIELPTRIFIIELKFNKSAQEGMDQIKAKKYVQKYQVKGLPIVGVGINIALKGDGKPTGSDNRYVFDVMWEQLA